jgi:hypothetical protein
MKAYLFLYESTGVSWDDKELTIYPGHGPNFSFNLREYDYDSDDAP